MSGPDNTTPAPLLHQGRHVHAHGFVTTMTRTGQPVGMLDVISKTAPQRGRCHVGMELHYTGFSVEWALTAQAAEALASLLQRAAAMARDVESALADKAQPAAPASTTGKEGAA